MPVGEHVVVSGRMEWFNGRPTMVHPDHVAPLDGAAGSEAAFKQLHDPVQRPSPDAVRALVSLGVGVAIGATWFLSTRDWR